MTAPFRTHGIDLRTFERLSGSVYAFQGTVQVGTAFPVIIAQPDGDWYGRLSGQAAVRFGTRIEAFAHILGAKPLLTTRGVDLYEAGDMVFGYRGAVLAGATWHSGVEWRARKAVEEFDYRVASRHSGIAYFVRGCPDCVCDLERCEADDTGEHCEIANCGFCLNGCSEDEHDARAGWPA